MSVAPPLRCAGCNREFSAGVKFCGECGSALVEKRPPPVPEPAMSAPQASTVIDGDLADQRDALAAKTDTVFPSGVAVARTQVVGGNITSTSNTTTIINNITQAFQEDRENPQQYLEALHSNTVGLVPLDSSAVERWARCLHERRVLFLTCVDRDVLNSAARLVPFQSQFVSCRKLQVVRGEMPVVWDLLESRTGDPAVVVVYAADRSAERFLTSLCIDPYRRTDLERVLEDTATWVLVLTTPSLMKAAGLQGGLPREWVETEVDFVGPRLRAAFGGAAAVLEQEFMRQRKAGLWGGTDERVAELLTQGAADGSLKQRIDRAHGIEGGPACRDDNPPTWNALLNVEPPEERALNELILFVIAFFRENPEEPLPGLPLDRFDVIVRTLIPFAAPDACLAAGATPDDSPAFRLERMWRRQATQLMSACGIRILKSSSGAVIAALGDRSWRGELTALFGESQFQWVFGRLAGYVRDPQFILGQEDMSRGASQVAAVQAIASPTYDNQVLAQWILACAPAAGGAVGENERLALLWQSLTRERRAALLVWTGDVIREWHQPDRAVSAVGRFIDLGAHWLAAGLLRRLWGVGGLLQGSLTLAKRLLSEAPSDVRDQVVRQMRGAIRQGSLPISTLWGPDWIPIDASGSNLREEVAARLLVEICESSLAGLQVHSPLGGVLQDGEQGQVQSLVSWLWHPLATRTIEARAIRVAALPGLWMFPLSLRRRVMSDALEAAPILLMAWWEAFSAASRDTVSAVGPSPVLFRAMTLTDWLTCFPGDKTELAVGASLRTVVPKAGLASLRQCLGAIDDGFGRVVATLLAGPVLPANDRRAIEAHLKGLRSQLRRLRRMASTSTTHSLDL
ncbi:MAG TPA: hypothetical protein VN700_07840 [Vicinamibacterales bacterium]|nr:hypothetical protein [Vicinamibacterales bacterium]